MAFLVSRYGSKLLIERTRSRAHWARAPAHSLKAAHNRLPIFYKAGGVVLNAVVLFFLSKYSFSDYTSYEVIYEYANVYLGWGRPDYEGWNRAFIVLLQLTSSWEISYTEFRLFVVALGIVYFVNLVRKPPFYISNQRAVFIIWIYFLLLPIFLLEFYVVRLRAGLSILLFFCGFVLEWPACRRRISVPGRLRQGICLAGSAALHEATFLVLVVFLAMPYAFMRYSPRRWRFRPAILFVGMLLIWLVVFYIVVAFSDMRGAHLFSQLNWFRFLALTFFPVAIFLLFDLRNIRRLSLYADQKLFHFPFAFSVGYLAAALALSLFYFSGSLETSGEAVVRVMTLSSAGGVVVVALWGVSRLQFVPVYLLACNSLFFIKTLYF